MGKKVSLKRRTCRDEDGVEWSRGACSRPFGPRSFFSLVLVFAALLLCFPPRVHADGGAPNLAYVAGTIQGIGIIDVAQQRVTGTISVGGDPYTILLSPDGRFLYVTQPAVRRIAVVAAKTG